jgi:hypothetical protein
MRVDKDDTGDSRDIDPGTGSVGWPLAAIVLLLVVVGGSILVQTGIDLPGGAPEARLPSE